MGGYISKHWSLCGGEKDAFHHVTRDYVVPQVPHDMTLPLQHYFISAGHNSYLTGNQLTSKCGVTVIEECLRSGCRVIELDVYNGDKSQQWKGPLVYHGKTLTSAVSFEDCVAAVARSAFTSSPYPVILTLEDHCDEANQDQIAEVLKEVLGDKLFRPPAGPPIKDFLSPEELQGKVVLRDKCREIKSTSLLELVYVNNIKFGSFDAEDDPTSCGSVSFEETRLPDLVELMPDVLRFAARHIVRVYPGGFRVDSSNYDPTLAWSVGAQVVALNWQDWGREVQMCIGKFQGNLGRGYLLKPQWMRQGPFTFNGVPPPRAPRHLKVHILTAHIPPTKVPCFIMKDDLYVKVKVRGMPMDRKSRRTRCANNTHTHCFDHVVDFQVCYPELALLVVELRDEDVGGHDLLGQRVIPLDTLVPGEYRLQLRDKKGIQHGHGNMWVSCKLSWLSDHGEEQHVLSPEEVRHQAKGVAQALETKAVNAAVGVSKEGRQF